MKLSTKAAIYSGIVFPGSGYFVVGMTKRGVIALLITLAALTVMFMEAYYKAQIIAQQIVLGTIPYDISIIREQIVTTPGRLSPDVLSIITLIIGLVWVVSIIDSYRIGRTVESKSQI